MSTLQEMVLANAVAVTLLAIVLVPVTRILKNAYFAHALWLIVLIKLFTPPLLGVPGLELMDQRYSAIELERRPADGRAEAAISIPSNASFNTSVPSAGEALWPPSLSKPVDLASISGRVGRVLWSVWGIGSLLIFVVAIRRIARFNRLLALAAPAPEDVNGEVARLAESMGLRKAPDVVVIRRPISPALWAGFRQARIILPEVAVDRMSAVHRRGILAHELAHYRRRDHWVRWLELAATTVYWWHPVVWLARRELRFAEELCCDTIAIAAIHETTARSYASGLLALLDECDMTASSFASAMGTELQLKRRIQMLADGILAQRMGRGMQVCLAAFAAVALLFGSTRAQDANPQPSPENRSDDDQVVAAEQDLIGPGDILEIVVAGSLPEAPINGRHVVEANGEVALGAHYGSVNLAGQTMLQAEKKVAEHLGTILQAPEPMVRVPLHPPFKVAVPSAPYRVAAGDVVLIRAAGVLPEQPIDGLFRVEPSGTVALGPSYGRAKIAGLSLRDAEHAVVKKLAIVLQAPEASVTHGEWLLEPIRPIAGVANPPAPTEAEQRYLRVLQQHLERAKASYEAGAGTQLNFEVAKFELAAARARFAASRDDDRQATSEYKNALVHANKAVSLVEAEYNHGLAPMTSVLEVAKKRLEVELLLSKYEQSMTRAAASRAANADAAD